MGAFLVTSVSGFFAAYLVLYTALLPYLLRWLRPAGGPRGMALHYCIGYLVFGVLMVHMFVSMQAGMAKGADFTGLNLATGALFLVMLQVMLGTTLMAGGPKARALRTVHFSLMLGIVVLSLVHVALNSALLHSFSAG